MKTKGVASSYKGRFGSVEEARESDKVICLIPSQDGRIYEMRKTEQGEFIAPKNNVVEFQQVRAGLPDPAEDPDAADWAARGVFPLLYAGRGGI